MAFSTGGRGELNSEINVTPFVDVMLVLLVIFMITAPLLNTGVEVDLPKTDTAPIKDPKGNPTLTITAGKELFLDTQKVTWADLGNTLRDNGRIKQAGMLQVAASQGLPYSVVVTAMGIAQNANVGKIQLVSDPGAMLDVVSLDKGELVPAAGPQGQPAAPPAR